MTPEFLQLRDGPLVRVDAVHLAIDLCARGITLRVDQGALKASPARLLTPADVQAIKAVKHHLMAIADYHPDDSHLR